MDDNVKYINASALSNEVRKSNDTPLQKLYVDALLAAAPGVTRDDIVGRGMWRQFTRKIPQPDGSYTLHSYSICSECEREISGWNHECFCPTCGRRMNILTLQELDVYHAMHVSAHKV